MLLQISFGTGNGTQSNRIFGKDVADLVKFRRRVITLCNGKNITTIRIFVQGVGSLYKDPDGSYILSVAKSDHSPAEFNKVCNILSEYAVGLRTVPGSEAYLEEHFEVILRDQALQSLARI